MKLSIVIVHYNVRYFLEQCLQSVQDACATIDSEIIVVDNASSDDSREMCAQRFPNVKWIQNQENVGFSKANNQGVEIAKGKYIVILNPDTVVSENTFTKLLSFASERKNLGIVGVKLIDGHGQFLPESKRGIPTPIVSFSKLFGLSSKQTGKYYASHLKSDESGIVDILVGAFMFVKRSVYNEVKGFDEAFFMYGEDIDLSYKVLIKGYQNYYFAKTKVIHYKGESTTKSVKYLKHFNEAMNIFYKKHFRLNLVYDFFMKLGIKLWYFLKYFKLKSTPEKPSKVNRFMLVSDNDAQLEKVKKLFACQDCKRVENTDLSSLLSEAKTIDTIIFDNNFVVNEAIIETIDAYRNQGVKFRFIPKNSKFIIGSDDSVSKGSVTVF